MSVPGVSYASEAIEAIVARLEDAGLSPSRDAGAFHPQPLGILVGLPALIARGLASRTFEIPVHVVSADPLNGPGQVDRLYVLADLVAATLATDSYAPADWIGGVNVEPLPSVLVTCVITIGGEI